MPRAASDTRDKGMAFLISTAVSGALAANCDRQSLEPRRWSRSTNCLAERVSMEKHLLILSFAYDRRRSLVVE